MGVRIFWKTVLFLIVSVPFIGGVSYGAEGRIDFSRSELSVLTARHKYKFNIEIATTPDQQERGLMFRKKMADRHGMLFLFTKSQMITMWMKNTYIPLDIIFINRKGVIVRIAKNAVPHSLDYISSGTPVISALEVNAGVTDRLEIKPGDRIDYPFFRH